MMTTTSVPKKLPKAIIQPGAAAGQPAQLFERISDGDFDGYALVKGVVAAADQNPFLNWVGAKIPLSEWHKWLAFAQFIFERDNSECQANLMYDKIDKKWAIWPFPQRGKTGMTTQEIENEEAARQRSEFFPSVELDDSGRTLKDASGKPVYRWVCMGSVHTHCDAGAFQSGTDTANEKNRDGIHITVGKMRDAVYDLHFRVYYRGVGYVCLPESWFDAGDPTEAESRLRDLGLVMTAEQRRALILRPLTQKAPESTTYPEIWLDNVVIAPPDHRHTYVGNGVGAYGGMGANASDYSTGQQQVWQGKTYGGGKAWKAENLLRIIEHNKKIAPEDLIDIVDFVEKNQAAYEFCRAFTKICDIDEKEWGDILDGLQDMLAKIWNKEIEQDKADDERLDRQRSLDMIGYGDQ